MISRSLAAGVVFGVALALGRTAVSAPPPDAKARVREVCTTTVDDVAVDHHQLLLDKIIGLGEEGRKALLQIAASKEPVAPCAMDYLLELKDVRVLQVIRKVLRSGSAAKSVKVAALVGVGSLRDIASFDKVMEAFRSGDFDLVCSAARALGRLGDKRGLQALLKQIDNPDYPRWDIARALGIKGYDEAIDPLLRLLADPAGAKYESLKEDLVVSLARIGGTRGRAAALAALEGYMNHQYRTEVAWQVAKVFFEQKKGAVDPAEVIALDEAMAKAMALAEARR